MKKIFQNNIFYVFLILILNIHYFLWGEKNHIIIPDNLELEFLYRHLLKISDNLLNPDNQALINNLYHNGLNISHIHSRFNLLDLLFYFLPSYYAYSVNNLFIRIIGYFSFLYMLKALDFKNSFSKPISFSYSLIPVLPIYGLTVIGLPLLVCAFINLFKNKSVIFSYILIFFYVVYSTPLTYPFILLWIILISIFYYKNFLHNNSSVIRILCGTAFFVLCFLLTEGGLLDNSLNDTHRILRANFPYENTSITGFIYYNFINLFFGQFHPSLMINISVIVFLILLFFRKPSKMQLFIFSIFVINIIIFALRPNIQMVLGSIYNKFHVIDLGRSIWLNPLLSYILLIYLIKDFTLKKSIVNILIVAAVFLNLIRNPEFSINYLGEKSIHFFDEQKILFNVLKNENIPNHVEMKGLESYEDYYSVLLFKKIKNYLYHPENDNARIINIGLSPSIPLYNGIYTLDGLSTSHSIDYHRIFDRLQINNPINADHGLLINKYDYDVLKMDLDYNLLKDLNCKYIFSDSELINYDQNLVYLNKFQNNKYEIFIYQIKNP
jgi:hypothetical protein